MCRFAQSFGEYIGQLIFSGYPGEVGFLFLQCLIGDLEFLFYMLRLFFGSILARNFHCRLIVAKNVDCEGDTKDVSE